MTCYHHRGREVVVPCAQCGAQLCRECAQLYDQPLCGSCASRGYAELKADLQKLIIIGIAIGIVWIVVLACSGSPISPIGIILEGIGIACVPFGWRTLTGITPKMFVWLPLLGWVLYFFIKFCISILIGWVCLPVMLYNTRNTFRTIEQTEALRSQISMED